jgi:amino acid permease
MIKISSILGFIIFGIVIFFFPNVGFNAYHEGGNLLGSKGFGGLPLGIISAAFAFAGTESVGLTAAEAKNPRKTIPKSVIGAFVKISLLYLMSIFIVGLIVPANSPDLIESKDKSAIPPFVLAFNIVNVSSGAHILNAIMLMALISSGVATVYVSARTVVGLSDAGHAPKIFSRRTTAGVPYIAVLFSGCFGLFSLLSILLGEGVIFNFLVNTIGFSTIYTWMIISITHLRLLFVNIDSARLTLHRVKNKVKYRF